MPSIGLKDLAGMYSLDDFRSMAKALSWIEAEGDKPATLIASQIRLLSTLETIAATSSIPAKRFIDSNGALSGVSSIRVIGLAPEAIPIGTKGVINSHGLHFATADCPLAANDPIKVGAAGRATKHTTTQFDIQTAIAGEAASFTQPGAATALEILQAVDVEADRGRAVVIEGSDALGAAITETIALDETDTTTPVAGSVEFTTVSAVYMADGDALGAQDVTIRAEGAGADVCTLAGATSELGADIPSESQEAYCNKLTLTGPDTDATFITIVGIDSSDAEVRERCQLDGASPSKVTSTTVWRYVNRICLGEFTDGGAGAVQSDSTTDTAAMKCGAVVSAALARGNDALVLVKPNL